MKKCPGCKKTKNLERFWHCKERKDGRQVYCAKCATERDREYRKNYNILNKEKIAIRKSKWRIERRIKVLEHYGNSMCSCCGEKEILFLSLDHINGGGSKERRDIKRAGDSFYRWIIVNNYPNGFRVLCHNCNWGVHVNKGICPHKLKVSDT